MRFSTFSKTVAGALFALCFGVDASAQICPQPDIWEPNNNLASLPTLPLGVIQDLTMEGVFLIDSWRYTMAAGETLTVDALFSHSGGNLDLLLTNGTGSQGLASSTSATDNEQLSYANQSGGPFDVVLTVITSGAFFGCNDYVLVVNSVIDSCIGVVDDVAEPNDDCSQAIALSTGTYLDLVVLRAPIVSDDFFKIDVMDGGTLNMDVLFIDAYGDIDAYIYAGPPVGTGCGDKLNYLVRGYSASDDEHLSFTNNSGATKTYYLQVNLYASPNNTSCNTYDLVLGIDPPGVGTPMCFGDGSSGACPCGNESALGAGQGCKSSLGYGSILSASGSTSVAADDIAFTVTQARANQTGMLVQGASLTQTPFKDGILCAGNPTERVEVVFTNSAGIASTSGSIVTAGSVSPGNARIYQLWSRDPGGVSPCATGSNFSNGLFVIYTP